VFNQNRTLIPGDAKREYFPQTLRDWDRIGELVLRWKATISRRRDDEKWPQMPPQRPRLPPICTILLGPVGLRIIGIFGAIQFTKADSAVLISEQTGRFS
jgi:hypothetical protein